jgi:hypothetical protein
MTLTCKPDAKTHVEIITHTESRGCPHSASHLFKNQGAEEVLNTRELSRHNERSSDSLKRHFLCAFFLDAASKIDWERTTDLTMDRYERKKVGYDRLAGRIAW